MNTKINEYLLKAIDAYPYEIEKAIASLDYAMSYNRDCPLTLGLMGKVYAEQFMDYKTAIEYFHEALAIDIYALKIYEDYIATLIQVEDHDRAIAFIKFALTVKGTEKDSLYYNLSVIYDTQKKYTLALVALKNVMLNAYGEKYEEVVDLVKRDQLQIISKQKVVS